ncbi:hypothetical protein NP233_g12015 [Leucocoprinus birnbaumii]|uniref:G domain-containing protein n=1 Tax=Leucocoprinus birnbaumii TaxID=56174 RepID=A0AAD5VL45_9AGAR|nr:hypothetical protein NP233_g12015 [Leucocoprinus birnbaumii]
MGLFTSKFHDYGNDPDNEIRIAVVGRTGSGISQLIHDITGIYKHGVASGISLRPFTQEITEVTTPSTLPSLPDVGKVVFIDTPGFDFSRGNSEQDMFMRLSQWVKRRYGSKVRLTGIIYMHNIWAEELIRRPPLLTSNALQDICGPDWREKIVFVNSHWSEEVQENGDEREEHLKGSYWSFMLSKGSKMTRYEAPERQDKAVEILRHILNEPEPHQETRIAQSQLIHDATGTYEHGLISGDGLRPFTTEITAINTTLEGFPHSGKVVLIDTPGFDFMQGNTEHDRFSELAEWAKQQYGPKARLDGIIYMHNIWNEELIHRSALLTSEALENLCGVGWRRKVIFVNSHWSEKVREDR